MLFFVFLVGIIPISFAEEDSKKISWEKATLDSKYFIHFQAQTRNADGSLVSVVETIHGEYLSFLSNQNLSGSPDILIPNQQ